MSTPLLDDLDVCPVGQLTPQPLTWLWPGRLALGKLAILEGDPGLGKSLVTLDLCARLSTGRPMPDGTPGPGVGNALVLNGEDGQADTLRPRLQALGADMERVFVLRPRDVNLNGLRLPSQVDRLAHVLTQMQAQLVVFDPIVAFLEARVFTGDDKSVRQALLPLAQLADEQRCVMKLVRHLNKTGRQHAVYRGGGSIGFLAACRSGWLVGRDPREPDTCVLAQVKNNLAPAQPSLAYQVVRQADGPPQLAWLGPSNWSADQLLAGAARGRRPRRLEQACAFLRALLAPRPLTAPEIERDARLHGLSARTLRRAREKLSIRFVRVHQNGQQQTYWLLPEQRMPADLPPEAEYLDLQDWLRYQREQLPQLTPPEVV